MLKRGLAFCTTLVMASVVQAGATITLEPHTPGPYVAGTGVLVDVLLANDGGDSDHSLRFIQLDFSNSSPGLIDCGVPATGCLSPPQTHGQGCPNGVAGSGSVRFWEFSSTTICSNDSTDCGCGHFLEQSLSGPRPNVLSSTYYFTDPANLGENTDAQRVLAGNGTPLLIGTIFVNLPDTDGTYTVDVMGSATNPDLGGADVRWGFGANIGPSNEPLTSWRNGSGLSGGSVDLCVGAGCDGDPCTLVSADPADQGSLWRTAKNISRVSFACTGGGDPLVDTSSIMIQELIAGGTYGSDLAAGFSITVEPGNVVRIQDGAANLAHRTWYAIRSTGNAAIDPFLIQYVVQVGDADGNRFVLPSDVGAVNASPPGLVADDSRFDIDGNGFRLASDVGLANAGQGPLPPKPAGH